MKQASNRSERGFAKAAILASTAVGALTVGLVVGHVVEPKESAAIPEIATEEYGRRLLTETAELLGPHNPDPAMRYSGSGLACTSCHLTSGVEPGTLNLLDAAERYPRKSSRSGGSEDIEERINGCMRRSMNGKELPVDSPEMIAMAAYIRSLGKRKAAMGASLLKADEPAGFKRPVRGANLVAGKQVFAENCARCHGPDGEGVHASGNVADAYAIPPLWGPDSYNNGAGMNRVLTAARFIKARMPLGRPDLTDDEAYDVAAFINSQPRPQMDGLEADFPTLSDKPVDSGYPPYADDFPQAQHQFGPFEPIESYYKALRADAPKGAAKK